jgi:acyl carrier protein
MVALIDNEFGVKIQSAELAKIPTFAALYDYLAERVK